MFSTLLGSSLRSPKLGLKCLMASALEPRIIQLRTVHRKSVYKHEEAKKIRFYILTRFIEYLKNYDKVLEKTFPTTVTTYRTFTEGVKKFVLDTKDYFKIVGMLNDSNIKFTKLLRRDIELYHQLPKDMLKVAPTLIISALPFALYVTLPMIYLFPKQLLCSHFWTAEQKSKFSTVYLKARLKHSRPVFRHLQSQLNFIKKNRNELFEPWANVIGLLGSGARPTVDQILVCKELFHDEPYHLYYLSRNHIKHLLKVHDLHSGWFKRARLDDRATILIEMDKAIKREGGAHNLPFEALRNTCYIRGLNPNNLSQQYMVDWLNQWIKISSQIDHDSMSLLLHVPILLGYNEPSNWKLIYPVKEVLPR